MFRPAAVLVAALVASASDNRRLRTSMQVSPLPKIRRRQRDLWCGASLAHRSTTTRPYSRHDAVRERRGWHVHQHLEHDGRPEHNVFDQLPNILAGNAYINFHTVQFPGGEIRGALIAPIPEPETYAFVKQAENDSA